MDIEIQGCASPVLEMLQYRHTPTHILPVMSRALKTPNIM